MTPALLDRWHASALTSLGLFWTAFWAFALGYLISSLIQVLVTRERMQRAMGRDGPKAVALGTVFGFLSSSCSFAALSGARALFVKGAGLVPSLAFLLASTNLVVELGLIIALFLGWQFVVGEYVGGALLILLMWAAVRLTQSLAPVAEAREHAAAREDGHTHGGDEAADWQSLIRSRDGWARIAERYVGEWAMVWKDVTVGFTVAGIIAVFVPSAFFEWLFIGGASPTVVEVFAQAVVGPIAAFFTFIGSMGNIPLAAVLYGNGVSFAGIMAFIFSDLIVLPVLRVNATYYGWKMALYILGVFFVVLVLTAPLLHYGFALFGLLPSGEQVRAVAERDLFRLNYTFWLNVGGIVLTLVFFGWTFRRRGFRLDRGEGVIDRALFWLAGVSFVWLAVGLFVGG